MRSYMVAALIAATLMPVAAWAEQANWTGTQAISGYENTPVWCKYEYRGKKTFWGSYFTFWRRYPAGTIGCPGSVSVDPARLDAELTEIP